VVKSSALSIWQRNVQLALWSLCIFGPLALRDAARAGASPFAGWRALDVLTALLGSAGGLLVALVIARFDSIVKSIAVAMSIVVTGLASAALLGAQLTLPFALASSVVVIATVNYTFGQ
jgi:UDP-sugar transporter A1/2/3